MSRPSPELNQLIEVKENALSKEQSKHFGQNVRSGIMGTIGGAITGTGAIIMGGVIGLINVSKNIVKHDPAMLKKLEETGEKLERITYSPHFEREFAKMEKELVQTGEELIARTGPISQSMLKHPKSWVAGFAVAGAGLGVMWQSRVQQHKTEEAQQEINALKTVKGQWSEHVQQGAESELSTGR